ncbi:MAG: KpsF/GutQ family sugar-phosphate isomerase [Alphaproteobacteria bacterium]
MSVLHVNKSTSSAQHILDVGRSVISDEIASLIKLKECLGDQYIQAINRLLACKGRVVLCGIGKSGHIARKIAATLASTGTPSIFVHPSEANHGDMGMITRDDVIFALSYSGETAELMGITHYAKRFGIFLIVVTRNIESSLGKAADVLFELPVVRDGGEMGLAPTSSTAMMLALGDAIAITLMHERGFSEEDFRIYHPGGALGTKLLQVKDLMHSQENTPIILETAPMSEAIIEMSAKGFGCVGVVNDDGQLVGIVTDGDLRRHMGQELLNQQVKNIMTKNPQVTAPQVLAATVLGIMNSRRITSLFVLENKQPVGFIHIHDCLRAGVK